MIAKIKANKSVAETLGYNLKDESEFLCVFNLEGEHIQEYETQMKLTQRLYSGWGENLCAHCIISPDKEDGKKLSTHEWKAIAEKYLVKMKLDKQEAVTFVHRDKEHMHLHLVINRVKENGRLYKANGNELSLSHKAGQEIADELGLVNVKKRAEAISSESERLRRQSAENVERRRVLVHSIVCALHDNQTLNHSIFFAEIEKRGYQVRLYIDTETNTAKGYTLIDNKGKQYRASDIGKEYSLSKLETEEGIKKILLQYELLRDWAQRKAMQKESNDVEIQNTWVRRI